MIDFDIDRLILRIEDREAQLAFSHAELARRIGVKPSTVTGIIYKLQQPRLWHLEAMARELGVSPGWLAFGSAAETMDDEEASIVRAWRKLSPAEREAWERMLLATTAGRAEAKTERVTRAKAAEATEQAGDAETAKPAARARRARADGAPPTPRQQALAAILLMSQQMKPLPVESEEWQLLDRASRLIKRLCVVPGSEQGPDHRTPVLETAGANKGASGVADGSDGKKHGRSDASKIPPRNLK